MSTIHIKTAKTNKKFHSLTKEETNMGSEEAEEEAKTTLLPLLSVRHTVESPERSGMETPPLYTTASIPFRWEEEPGKPKDTCRSMSEPDNEFAHKCLELPPRLLFAAQNAKLASPKTVLEGPYLHGRLRFQSSSFRMAGECYSTGNNWSPERRHLGALVLSKRWDKDKEKSLLDSLGIKKLNFMGTNDECDGNGYKKVSKENHGGSYVFPSSVDREYEGEEINEKVNVKLARMRRSGSLPLFSRSKSPFWMTIYENLKQRVPWRRRKTKKNKRSL